MDIANQSVQPTPASAEGEVFLHSFGAAGTVTGSKHLLSTPEMNILVDCGLFQGLKSLRLKNWEPLPFDPAKLGAVCLTHAHLDHCGYLPRLIAQGYRGKFFMTAPTRELAAIILRDSAKLQQEDAWKANRGGYSRHHPALPLYTIAQVEEAIKHFTVVPDKVPFALGAHISVEFSPCGHIPGACSVRVELYGKTILFSGDIGRERSEFLSAPAPVAPADFLIMESTYGDRLHAREQTDELLKNIIIDTMAVGGNVLIPCFAVGRAQEIISILHRLRVNGSIPRELAIYLDSPMASAACAILLRYPEWTKITRKQSSAMMQEVTINEKDEHTLKIIQNKKSKVIIAGSGMLTGGRILEYLKHDVGNDRNTIVLTGFQAEGTRGRILQNHTHELRIDGRYYPVHARTVVLEGLSSHADQQELIAWLTGAAKKQAGVFLVHGEAGAMESLRVRIRAVLGIQAHISLEGEKNVLFSVPR